MIALHGIGKLTAGRRPKPVNCPFGDHALIMEHVQSPSSHRKRRQGLTEITQLDEERLPEGDVTVRVQYSTLNYKDGLILNGLGRLVRNYPHVPGVDFAGVVEASQHPGFKPSDNVILTGWRVGEAHWGGYAERARVKGDWLVKLPADLTARNAMAIGTAGFTAMLCVMALE